MIAPDIPTFDFKHAAALQFGDRPTLRQVASEQLLKVLLAELPWLAFVSPTLISADPLMLDSPEPDTDYWTTQPFVDRVLLALLEPPPLDIEPVDGRHHNLGLLATHRFAGSTSEFDTRQLSGVSNVLDNLVKQLPQLFCEAQLAYWSEQGSAGVSRDLWLQLLLKSALLRGLPLQALDKKEQACIRGLIRGGADQPSVWLVKATLTSATVTTEETLCNLLVTGEWDEQQVVLWCAPSGVVRSFGSLGAFGRALRDELAQRYSFEQLSWTRYAAEGNIFAQQVSLLLETLFNRVERLAYRGITDVTELEQRFAQLSDPSSWFISYADDTAAVQPPPGWRRSTAENSFACHAGLLQLALDQLDSDGVAALDGVQTLNEYAREQLVEQIHADYSDDSSPDDLLLDLYLARGEPGGPAAGAGGGEPLVFVGSKSLTEFAIGNLVSLKGAAIEKVRRRDGSEAPPWLDAEAARRLVTQVDIGGRYPAYVAGQLDDSGRRPERIRRFAREWRSALLQSAITAKLDGKVKEGGLQCVVDYCAGHVDPDTPRMMLIPLAFRRSQHSRQSDPVHCMYMLFCAEPSLVLLYRPLFRQDTLREYASLPAVLEHVRESRLLQAGILDWMDPAVRSVYDNGGFSEPHVTAIGIDPYALPERPEPVELAIEFWRNNVDERLYAANRDVLLMLADQQSVSNAESRWQTLCEGAWLLFDVATLLVRGPVASVAWLVQSLSALQADLQALEQGNDFERSAAIADLLLNMGMTLLHAHHPKLEVTPESGLPDASAFECPPPQSGAFSELAVKPVQSAESAGEVLPAYFGQYTDFSFRGRQGFNSLPLRQREKLLAMRSSVSLNGVKPHTVGDAAGLYQMGDSYYASLAGEVYRVELSSIGARVVDAQGRYGAWLIPFDGVWRVNAGMGIGGMEASALSLNISKRFKKLSSSASALEVQARSLRTEFATLGKSIIAQRDKLSKLQGIRAGAQAKVDEQPQGSDTAAARAAISQYDERIAQWQADLLNLRKETVAKLEQVLHKEEQLLPLLTAMQEAKYATERAAGHWGTIVPETEVALRVRLIRDSHFVFRELQTLAEIRELSELQERLIAATGDEIIEVYLLWRSKLEVLAGFKDRMLLAYERLDNLLANASDELQINGLLGGETLTVRQMISLRNVSTVQLRFNQIITLADLSLHDDVAGVGETLATYRSELKGSSLRNAAGAHGVLDFVNLSAEDRIGILQEAWDEYSAAILNSSSILTAGGQHIEPAMLERYRAHVEKLKLDAGRRLVEAVQEQEGSAATGTRAPYSASSDQHRVVRNNQGQLLIGTEVEQDGQRIVEIRESFSNEVLATFDWVDGQWRQRQAQPIPSPGPAPSTDLAMRVQALLDENAVIESKAKAYVANDIKAGLLAQLFDGQLEKLDRVVADLREEGSGDALVRQLESAADRLRSDKNLQLTTLYTGTHYPSAQALQFLHQQGLIKVEYIARKTMHDGSTFDEYKIMRLTKPGDSQGRNLWAAHFHFLAADAFAEEFTHGHLKTWRQRSMSNRAESAAGERVHRGRLTLEQARGIIPFV